MKKSFRILLFVCVSAFSANAQTDTVWTKEKADKWFDDMQWLRASQPQEKKYDAFGRELVSDDTTTAVITTVKPDPSANRLQFAKDYHAFPARWNKAFYYLQHTDFSALEAGKYLIDSTDVFAVITIGPAKLIDTTMWEDHHHYDDIHYVISGKEKLGIVPVSQAKLKKAYEPDHDIAHYDAKGKYYTAEPGTFFIITTKEAHRPNLQTEGSGIVKKLYIKVKID